MATLATPSRTISRPLARVRSLLQHWKRDPRLPRPGTSEWEREAQRQARQIADSPGEAEDLAFMESLHRD